MKRKLRADELELWLSVAKTAEKLHPSRISAPHKATSVKKSKSLPSKPHFIEPFSIGQNTKGASIKHDLVAPLSERLARQPLAMDSKAFTKMKRGKLSPEGRIDLHGMTVDQAYPALIGFIIQSHAMGRRLVLVITGKGKSTPSDTVIPRQVGILKHQVPQWLRSPAVGNIVMQISESHISHGGSGAYYVYLRKKR